MRDIATEEVTGTVSRLFQDACYHLPDDVLAALKQARETEESPARREVLECPDRRR
jgi:tartrate dehydratase alpha subunit/fumarate hydratase class I-like protein